jgi:Fic family protein
VKRVFIGKLDERALKRLIQGGKTNIVELKVAVPRATDRTAHRDLEMLVERGRLKDTGQRSARRYVIA